MSSERHILAEELRSEISGGVPPDNGVTGERALKAERIMNTPLMIAAALTLPSVALSETHVGGSLETIAEILADQAGT